MSHEFLEGKGPKHDAAVQQLDQIISALPLDEIRFTTVMAQLLLHYPSGTRNLSEITDWYWLGYINQYVLPVCHVIYDELQLRKKTSPKKAFRFGSDDRFWIVKHKGMPEYKCFVQGLQSASFIYFFDDNYLHIRQFYSDYEIKDKYDQKDETQFKKEVQKHGKKWALRQEYQMDEYANDVLNCPRPTRFSYKYFTSPKFKFRFEDSRDDGYVISTRYARMTNTIGAISQHTLMKCLFDSCLTQALVFLFGYKHHCYLSKYFDANGDFKPELDDEWQPDNDDE